ncbi:hypothetical protein [Flintibacter muris]|uniref:hypothetical protein n=1 Tax=Flintibacter muris TaxID=2941327 RepID=UPI0020408592|nr:hypothetical protein [Flintibacter muris]
MRDAIAIDFDGCLCVNAYPGIGAPNWAVIAKAKERQTAGAGLILWTCREGTLLQAAVDACKGWGLTFDAINESLPDWIEAYGTRPRKVGATEYWDDRAVLAPVPNEPLTLAELRKMDGEPVWCEDFGCWGIVSVASRGNWKNRPFLLGLQHGVKFEYDIGRRKLKLYRHKL